MLLKLALENKQVEVIGIIKNNSFPEKKSFFIQRYLKTPVSNAVAVTELVSVCP